MGQWTGHSGGGAAMSTGECSSCGGGSTIDYTFQQQPRVLAGASPKDNRLSQPKVNRVSQAARPISTVRR